MRTMVRYYRVGDHVVEVRVILDEQWGTTLVPPDAVEISREDYVAATRSVTEAGADRAAQFGAVHVQAQVDGVADALGLTTEQAVKLHAVLVPQRASRERIVKTTRSK